MLREQTLFEYRDKVKESIQFLQDHEPPEGYYLAFSGGKDSICIKELADMAGVKYDAHYNVTTIDPPELVRFIKEHHSDVGFNHPKKPLVKELETRGFPTRIGRWCCGDYKEKGGKGRRIVTGIRAAESSKRAGRKPIEVCFKDASKIYINPIINWTDEDVWDFIKERGMPYCKLYDEGFKRIGCIMCPLASKQIRLREAKRYPKYLKLFLKAFITLHENKKGSREYYDKWENGEEMFWWWLNYDSKSDELPDQGVLFE